jgi:membrane dipeptidase
LGGASRPFFWCYDPDVYSRWTGILQLKKVVIVLVALVAVAAGIFFFAVPRYVDASHNKVSGDRAIAAPLGDLHKRLIVADLHADSLLWDRDLLKENDWGHVDIPRLIKGNIALQGFGVVTKTPRGLNIERNSAATDNIKLLSLAQRWPPRTWTSLQQRALYQAQKLHDFATRSNGTLVVIKSRADLLAYLAKRRAQSGVTAGWLTIEGAHALEGELANLDSLYQAGFRMIAPTHLADSDIASSASGEIQRGLTALGEKWVVEMERRKMIIDLAHASAQTIDDVLRLAKRPVIVSHTGAKGTCDNNRNLSDDQIKRIARVDGLIGIGFWPYATCGTDIAAIMKAIRYVVDLAGIEHVALGSDWDGYVATPIDAAGMGAITTALEKAGFDESAIRNIMGENVVRFLERALPESS